jgi:hypothetical protein
VGDQILPPYETTGEIAAVEIRMFMFLESRGEDDFEPKC